MKASVVIDTCSTTSTIEFDDLMRNRIIKIRQRIEYNQIHKEKDASTSSKEVDVKGTASVEKGTSHSRSDRVTQEPSTGEDMILASAENTGGNTLINEKDASDNIENDRNITDNDHEILDGNEEINGIVEVTTSKMDRGQIYLDDASVYEDENKEKPTNDSRSSISTSSIIRKTYAKRVQE